MSRVRRTKSFRTQLADVIWMEPVQNTFARYAFCQICGEPLKLAAASVHHIVPQREDGQHALNNLLLVHRTCHDWWEGTMPNLAKFKPRKNIVHGSLVTVPLAIAAYVRFPSIGTFAISAAALPGCLNDIWATWVVVSNHDTIYISSDAKTMTLNLSETRILF